MFYRRYPATFFLLFFLALAIDAQATQAYRPEMVNPLTERWRWKNFPELEGKGVRCITEDQNGNVWFGIDDGIVEYNGYEWIRRGAEDGLPGGAVEQIYSGRNDCIYAATAKGVFIYKANQWRPLFTPEESLGFTFLRIKELEDGSFWIATNFGALQFVDHRPFRFFATAAQKERLASQLNEIDWVILPEKLTSNGQIMNVSDVLEDKQGALWLALTVNNQGKILIFHPQDIQKEKLQKYKIIASGPALRLGENQKMIRAADHTIWIANSTFNIGITTFDGEQWRAIELSDLFGGDEYTTDIMQSSDGTIWIGSLGKMYSYRDGRWEIFQAPEFQIPANKLLLFQSREDKLWIGGVKSKVYLLDYSRTQWLTYRDLNFQCERNYAEYWFLDVHGRAVQNRGDQWIRYDTTDGLMDAPVRIIATGQGQLWAAGSHRGTAATAFLQGNRWIRRLHPNLSWGIDYRAVFEAKDGSIWFGAAVDLDEEKEQVGGVIQLLNPLDQNKRWIHHRPDESGIKQTNAYGIGQSKDGSIWMGGGNLYRFDGRQWAKSDQMMLRQFVNIVASTDQLLLVGSRYYGVFLFDGQEWRQYDTNSGLTSNTIISLYASSDSSIWAATENDIAHFDGKTWINHIFPAEMNMNLEGGAILGTSDGALWLNQSSREWKRRALRSHKPSGEALRSFVTYRYLPDRHPPETKLEIFTREVASEGNTIISWTGEDFFETTNSDQLTFSYRLNGGKWSDFSSERHRTFFNLRNGLYTFEVRARDLDLNIDPSPARFEFEVLPPVWRQTWFQLLLLAFLLVIGIFEFRIINKKRKLEKLNVALQTINQKLKKKSEKIQTQNQEILEQQEQILRQKAALEKINEGLADRNREIQLQRDKLEEMVVQIEELSKSKINFFTNISHELRTPLTLILGPVERLHQQGDSLSDTEKERFYAIIERNAYRLLKLINQLLEMRRIENNTLELKLCEGNLAAFLSDIVGSFDNLAAERKIRLSFENQCCNHAPARFDADKMEKILANLLSNAFKHTPAGGSISVRLSKQENGYFQITVQDTGEGIDKETLEHIFKRYYSASGDTQSTGIGLSYIKDLVSLHHGRIEVSSTAGRGARFSISLPAQLSTTNARENRQPNQAALELTRREVDHLINMHRSVNHSSSEKEATGRSKRILLVEDNEDMLTFLESLLIDEYVVLKARNGKEGLELAKKHHLDLIISDVMMPEMDGLAFCDAIKSTFATSHIPLILLTAKTMEEHRIEGYNTGADAYIAKPFNTELLRIRIQGLLKQRATLREKFARDFKLAPQEMQLTSPDEELLNKVVQIMEDHISDPEFNVNKMCEMVYLSHMHFIRKIKQLTGKKPIDLLKSFRLKRARDLLRQNKANISEVAHMVGYDLPNSFSRAFKKEFGVSPTEWVEREAVD
jgi:signal transduction histidine kinase/DNA-binding response OmpR family regulator/ligand-binding sensor domain-containing protein